MPDRAAIVTGASRGIGLALAQTLGEEGFGRLAGLSHERAVMTADRLAKVKGVEVLTPTFFNEFTLKLPVEARPAVHAMVEKGVLGGVSLGRLYPGAEALQNGLVIAVTETVSDEDITAFEAALKEVVR